MNDYILIFSNGSVLDAYRHPSIDEPMWIDRTIHSNPGLAEIHRRGDGVVVYQKEGSNG